MASAAIILIGNELLSGKIRDENGAWAARRLRVMGIDLRRVVTLPDIQADIVEELQRTSPKVDYVFTSGGVGPTHDDITIASVAAAFDVPLQLHPDLDAMIQAHFGERCTPAHRRMAEVPVGARLDFSGAMRWPVYVMQNVYILPGVPSLFRTKFDAISTTLRTGTFWLRSIYLDHMDEGAIAELLQSVEDAHPVSIGSYPRFGTPGEWRIRLTVEAREAAPVDAAIEALVAGLSPESILRVDASVSDSS
jgi:molybdenum cofactor synthesis domain-containing protein